MRNKTALIFILMLFLGCVCLQAQDNAVFGHPLSEQNMQKFDSICAQLASRPYTKGVFKQERKGKDLLLTSGGDFIIAADSGIVWLTKEPYPSTTALGKDYMVQSVPGGTVKKIDAKGNEMYMSMADTISSLFTGNAQKLKSGFTVYYMDELPAHSGSAWVIGLIPKNRTFRNYIPQIILAGIDDGNVITIRSIIMYQKDGGTWTYNFSQQNFPQVLEAHEKAYFSAD